jgi:hypothetical protein
MCSPRIPAAAVAQTRTKPEEDRAGYLGVVIGVLLLDDGSHISKLLPVRLDHEERLGVLLDLFGQTGDILESGKVRDPCSHQAQYRIQSQTA